MCQMMGGRARGRARGRAHGGQVVNSSRGQLTQTDNCIHIHNSSLWFCFRIHPTRKKKMLKMQSNISFPFFGKQVKTLPCLLRVRVPIMFLYTHHRFIRGWGWGGGQILFSSVWLLLLTTVLQLWAQQIAHNGHDPYLSAEIPHAHKTNSSYILISRLKR